MHKFSEYFGFAPSSYYVVEISRNLRKGNLWHVLPAKTHISLRIRITHQVLHMLSLENLVSWFTDCTALVDQTAKTYLSLNRAHHVIRYIFSCYGEYGEACVNRIYPKYWYTLTYHTSPKVWTSPFYYLLICPKPAGLSGKQCRPWSDAAFCGVWSGSLPFEYAYLSQYLGFIWYLLTDRLWPTEASATRRLMPIKIYTSFISISDRF